MEYPLSKNITKFEEITPEFTTLYQDPDIICFTRHSTLETGTRTIRKQDKIEFQFKQNPENRVNLKIFLHHPGQFIRHKDSPVAESVLYGNDKSQKIKLTIPTITILRKRSIESNECNERPMDDAVDFREKVIAEVKCTPSYWIPLFNDSGTFRICNTSIELQRVNRFIQTPNAILSMSHVPCAEMLIPLVKFYIKVI